MNQISTSDTTTEAFIPGDAQNEVLAPTVEESTAPAPVVASEPQPEPEPESVPAPVPEAEPKAEPEAELEPVQQTSVAPSAPRSESDPMGSLERQLEKDNEDMTGS
jgi:fused signal recognition particle receptor